MILGNLHRIQVNLFSIRLQTYCTRWNYLWTHLWCLWTCIAFNKLCEFMLITAFCFSFHWMGMVVGVEIPAYGLEVKGPNKVANLGRKLQIRRKKWPLKMCAGDVPNLFLYWNGHGKWEQPSIRSIWLTMSNDMNINYNYLIGITVYLSFQFLFHVLFIL